MNSQEDNDDIDWSSSETSEYFCDSFSERFCDLTNKPKTMRRKRKKKQMKNLSTLDITILEVPKNQKNTYSEVKSPIFKRNDRYSCTEKSPILKPYNTQVPGSPIIICKINEKKDKINHQLSPILMPKRTISKNSPQVRKKLFTPENTCDINFDDGKKSPILMSRRKTVPHSSKHVTNVKNEVNDKKIIFNNTDIIENSPKSKTDDVTKPLSLNEANGKKYKLINTDVLENSSKSNIDANVKPVSLDLVKNVKNEANDKKVKINNTDLLENSSKSNTDGLSKPLSLDLVKKVRSFFESNFSSESVRQISIHDTQTSKASSHSKSNEDIEITSSLTQNANKSRSPSVKEITSENVSTESCDSYFNMEKSKKTKYKKDGLAYRLNALFKKQNANISLWQHERFLAGNSNFLMPQKEHTVFRIQKVQFNYGCYLLEAVDVNNLKYLILINNHYVNSSLVFHNAVLKLYNPFSVLEFDRNCQLICNVTKYECVEV